MPGPARASTPVPTSRGRRGTWLGSAAGVLVGWALLLAFEALLVGTAYRSLLAGNWEIVWTRRLVLPIAFAALAPASGVAVALGWLASRARRDASARVALAFVSAAAAAA